MRSFSIVAMLLVLPTWLSASAGGEAVKPKAGVAVWDTAKPLGAELTAAALTGKNDWTAIAADKTADAFQGDAVLSNGRIAIVLRKQESAVELHAVKPITAPARVRLRLVTAAGEPAERLERVALVENNKSGACLEATFKTAKGDVVSGRFRLKRGDVALQAEPGTAAAKLVVECPGRFAILPDFFADDITIDATRMPIDAVDLPSENFVMHPIAGGDCLAMCVFENRQQDVKVTLTGKGDKRQITNTEIGFEKKKIWVALMEATQIWHLRDVSKADTNKVINLNWKMPFTAQWRVDFQKHDDLTDSWEMLLQEPGYRSYVRPTWLGKNQDGNDHETFSTSREHWNTVLGTYKYPCWTDDSGRGFLQPIKHKKLQFAGPALIYPIHRTKATPLDALTVVDVMRNTLGVGPCEHILDVQSHTEQYKGQATCGVRDILNPIYANKEQKRRRDEISKTLDDGLIFVKHIRGRINDYIEFGKKMRDYLAEQKKKSPDLADFIDGMDNLTQEIDRRVAARKDKIKSPEHVALMIADFRKNVLDYDGPDALERCKGFTIPLQKIGDNQDELSGELRWAVRTLRQRAGIRMALDPRVAQIAAEVRTRTQQVLRNPAWHEGARH